jgi:thioester reductase-like protein
MSIFLTGATGYLGSYVAHGLLTRFDERLSVLVRAKSHGDAQRRLWKAWQLHMDFATFRELLGRVDIYLGDLVEPELGIHDEERRKLVTSMTSVIHVAASLNRKSAKHCLNVNLRGTLSVIKLARAAADHHGLRRFSDVSTAAVAGERQDEVVTEAGTIDWNRSDYDPYARTKKFAEHMIHELLPDVPTTVFRPTIVLGDSRFPETTQFDMVRAFVMLAYSPVLPFRPDWRVDIVPADYVATAIVELHQGKPEYGEYSLSSGTASPTYADLVQALRSHGHPLRPMFLPGLRRPVSAMTSLLMATPRSLKLSLPASLLKVFLPYLTYNTVFDNRRVVSAVGYAPRPFVDYCYPLLRFAVESGFEYPAMPWPEGAGRDGAG